MDCTTENPLLRNRPQPMFTEEDVTFLKDQWLAIHTQNNSDLAMKYWTMFDTLYREPQRYYHNFYHLKKLYEFYSADALPLINQNFPTTELQERSKSIFLYSLWFHDVVYDPKSKDNERQSADIFNQYADQNPNINGAQREVVTDIILGTINHQIPEKLQTDSFNNFTTGLFLDADLSVLGWQKEQYEDYAWSIWKEYEFYGREKFCEGRSAVLTKMLSSRENLYFTLPIRDKYEAISRHNVGHEIKRLQAEHQILLKTLQTVIKAVPK